MLFRNNSDENNTCNRYSKQFKRATDFVSRSGIYLHRLVALFRSDYKEQRYLPSGTITSEKISYFANRTDTLLSISLFPRFPIAMHY